MLKIILRLAILFIFFFALFLLVAERVTLDNEQTFADTRAICQVSSHLVGACVPVRQ